MNDVEMVDQSQMENEESARRKRIQVYKSILKYYQGRSLSLDMALASKQPNIVVDPNLRTLQELKKNTRGLHDDITLMQSLKDCIKIINNSLTCAEIMGLNNFNFKGEILNKIEGIIAFSRSIMKLYNECYNDFDLIQKQKSYAALLAEYEKKLDAVKESEQNGDTKDERGLEKAELLIYKINLIRSMKAVLIGFISVNYPEIFPQVQKFQSPVRRNLTIEDFHDTWDVGLK